MRVAVGSCRHRERPQPSLGKEEIADTWPRPGVSDHGCDVLGAIRNALVITLATLSFSPSAQHGAVPCCR